MVFLANEHRKLPTNDILSWISDDPTYDPDKSVVQILPIPFFHAGAAPRVHTSALKAGYKTYVMRRFELEPYFTYSEKYQVTESAEVPPMIIAMIMSPLNKKYSLKSVKAELAGGAPLGSGPQQFFELLGGAPFTQARCMTKTTSIGTMLPWPEHDYIVSIGRAIATFDIKLVDENGKDITAFDIRGELCVRGPIVIPGYFENPGANRVKSKSWYIIDREKELIKVRGFQVAPPGIENGLLGHSDIVDAAVIGVPANEYDGEMPWAYVVRRPGSDASKLTEEVVKEYVGEKLAKYKRLEGGVRFWDVIPIQMLPERS